MQAGAPSALKTTAKAICGNLSPSTEVRALVRSLNRPIAMLALVALLVAQLAGGWHVLKHYGAQGDAAGLPGHHAPLCLECASFAPLSGAHGGAASHFEVAFIAAGGVMPLLEVATGSHRLHAPFQARAPPR